MIPILEREMKKESQSKNLRWVKILAALMLLSASLVAGLVTIHQHIPAAAAADDWPTYMHDPQRSGVSSDTILSPANAGQLTLKWTFQTNVGISASPTVVGGTVYIGSWDGYEYALDAATGDLKWKTFLGQTTAPCQPMLNGISSVATVQNGVVYVGGGDSYWYALDATSGTVLWKVFTGDNTQGYYNWSSPLIYNGYAYIGISSVGDCPLVHGELLRVDLSTHQIVGTFDIVPPGQLGGGVWSSPSLDTTTNTIYITTGTRNTPSQTMAEAIVAIDATTLSLKSSWPIPTLQEVLDSDFGTTPTLFNDASGDQLVVASNKNGIAYALNRNDLSTGPVWTQQIAIGGACPQCGDGTVSSGAFANGALYLAGGNTVFNGKGYQGSVNALDPASGNFLWQHAAPGYVIGSLTYSNGLIIDGGGKVLEVLDATSGRRLYSYTTGGAIYAGASVSNGLIFTGSQDGKVYAFGLPANPPPTPTPDPNCPNGWSCQDLGNPAPAGSETISGGTWSVQASGSGIGGSSDQFRFIAQNVSGDTQISAQVVSQQSTSGSAQAGLMIRQSSDPSAPYYALSFTNSNSLVAQYRSAFGGASSITKRVNAVSSPLYLEIQRVGDQFQAATSNDGVTYTLVPGTTENIPMPTTISEGTALSSGTQGTLDTAIYSSVSIGSPTTSPNPPPPATPCPGGWSCADVGNPTIVGDQSLNGGTWTLNGAGAQIDNNSDQFHYVWQSFATNASVSVHILSQNNTNGWAKAGIMLRQSTDAAAGYYAAFVTPSNGTVVQYRTNQGLGTTIIPLNSNNVPVYLMIARSSNSYCTYTSSDGVSWAFVLNTCVMLNLNGPTLAGLAVTSGNGAAMSNATFDTVNVSATAPPSPAACPSGWSCADIGNPALAGNRSYSGGTWTALGSGNDIWGASDQFHYVWQSLAADGSVSARVSSQTNTQGWAKAGVMLRQSTDPGSPYYFAFVTPGNGIVVQYRATQGGSAQQLAALAGTAPAYLMVARSGNTYTAYTSTDGNTWNLVPASSITLNTSGPMLAGMAVTSHNGSALSAVTFDTVSVSTTVP